MFRGAVLCWTLPPDPMVAEAMYFKVEADRGPGPENQVLCGSLDFSIPKLCALVVSKVKTSVAAEPWGKGTCPTFQKCPLFMVPTFCLRIRQNAST